MQENTIICGSAKEVLQGLSSESINCSISSPPYWAMRDYGVAGQLGLEKTFEEYIDKLCTIYDEVKRVLRPDGCCFVNLGDTYSNGTGEIGSKPSDVKRYTDGGQWFRQDEWSAKVEMNIPAKSLCLIPQRFAIEMVNRGWILRNVLIWHKPNPMPSSAKDRFTNDFEYVYFFVKSNETLSWVRPDGVMASKQPDYKSGVQGLDWQWGVRKGHRVKLSLWKGYCYFFEPIYEPYLTESNAERPRMGQGNQTKYKQKRAEGMGGAGTSWKGHSGNLKADGTAIGNPALGRNKRTVWTIPTQAYPDAHFATFPEKLVEPMILSGCPKEVCSKCGQGRRKVYERELSNTEGWGQSTKDHTGNLQGSQAAIRNEKGRCGDGQNTFKGYTDCGCEAEFRPGLVMDIFCGSGTTCKVAAQNGRNWLGIELKQEYIEMAKRRIAEGETGITVKEQLQGQGGLFEQI